MKKMFFIVLVIIAAVSAQKKDPDEILKRVKDNFSRVKDYEVDVNIKIDFDFIKAPDMNATVYFKQPDKMHLESESFAMLPKGGMNFSPEAILSGNYTSFYEKEEDLEGTMTSVVKIIPLDDSGGDIVLSTLWIDTKYERIRKVESTTKTQGTFSIELDYSSTDYPLPSKMVFSMNMDKQKLPIPKGLEEDLNTEEKEDSRDKKNAKEKTKNGKVVVTYSDYKVNKGISDKIFEQSNKKQN